MTTRAGGKSFPRQNLSGSTESEQGTQRPNAGDLRRWALVMESGAFRPHLLSGLLAGDRTAGAGVAIRLLARRRPSLDLLGVDDGRLLIGLLHEKPPSRQMGPLQAVWETGTGLVDFVQVDPALLALS